MKEAPAGREWGYDESGWPRFEGAVTNMVKDKDKVGNRAVVEASFVSLFH